MGQGEHDEILPLEKSPDKQQKLQFRAIYFYGEGGFRVFEFMGFKFSGFLFFFFTMRRFLFLYFHLCSSLAPT